MTVPRPTRIADAAIAVIAERGLRGLTHRAVDEAAGLPAGSTSNLARTRSALLELALARIAAVESDALAGGAPPPPADEPREALVALLAGGLHHALTAGRTLTAARIELALEAARRPELRAVYDRLGADFVDFTAELLTRCGSAEPAADARRLVRWCEGVLFNATAGSGHAHVPTREELATDAGVYLAALLDG